MVTTIDLKLRPAILKLTMEQWKQWKQYGIMIDHHGQYDFGNGYHKEKILVMMVGVTLVVCDMFLFFLYPYTLKKITKNQ